MAPLEPSAPLFDIDRSDLTSIRKRFLAFNQKRLERTLDSLNSRQQLFLELVPLLFHINHPSLPGYTSGKPRVGIINFKPDKILLKKARQFARSFRYPVLKTRGYGILSIFVMGSIGTVGQSRSSDLDFWICHDPRLSPREVELLRQRCDIIEQWADGIGLEVCFFLMNAQAFREGRVSELSEESSGSTQHKLLLDEFYRTAIHLAGQLPLWWFVPPQYESEYPAYTRQLLHQRFLRESEVLDLGGLDRLPAREFVTAAVWQLYKAIESPYKSLLKLLLLEVYSRRESDGDILCIKLKQAIYDNRASVDALDPYLLLFQSLSDYMQQGQQPQRLELVRRCFYFKVNKPLSQAPKTLPASWQRRLLSDMVHQWGWDNSQVKELDRRSQWKVARVVDEKKVLIAELLSSYRLLSEYAQNLDPVSNDQLQREIAILGRKLYAAFERKAGKIEWVNISISKDVSEDYLTFYQRQGAQLQWQWDALPQRKFEAPDFAQSFKSCGSLMEIFVWSYVNRVMMDHTSVTIRAGSRDINARGLYQACSEWLPQEQLQSLRPNFNDKPVPRRVLVAINVLSQDDQSSPAAEFPSVNPLAVGKNNHSLLHDIHIICCNSWNEITVHSYDQLPLEYFVREWLALFANVRGESDCEVSFYCEQRHHANSLKIRLEQIVKQLDRHLVRLPPHQAGQWFVGCGDEIICVEKHDQQMAVSRFWRLDDVMSHLQVPRSQHCAIAFDPLTLSGEPIAAIFRERLSPAIQVFYRADGDLAQIYLFDENNTLVQYAVPFCDEQLLLRPLHRFIRSVVARLQLARDGRDFGIYPVEFYRLQQQSSGQFKAERTHVTTELQNLQFFNLQAIASSDPEGVSGFSIYCGDLAFHPAELGESLYTRVAEHVLSKRRHGERYPCYLTDLDLGLSSLLQVDDAPMQVARFIEAKNRVEARLNQALQAL